MSEAVVAAVATALLSELGICDLATFTEMVRSDANAVLAVLESEACCDAADAAATNAATTLAAATPPPDVALQLQLLRDELRMVEQELTKLRSPAAPAPTIQRAAVAESWQRRSELPSLRAAAAADRKAAAADKKAAAVQRAEAAAVREAAAAQKHAAEQLMQTAKAK